MSIDVEEGEFVAIVGTSGSGKSTLLNLIGGIDQPTDGEAIIHMMPIFKEPLSKSRILFNLSLLFNIKKFL